MAAGRKGETVRAALASKYAREWWDRWSDELGLCPLGSSRPPCGECDDAFHSLEGAFSDYGARNFDDGERQAKTLMKWKEWKREQN